MKEPSDWKKMKRRMEDMSCNTGMMISPALFTELRRRYGDLLVIRGGIDKRELSKGREAINRELDRVTVTSLRICF